MGGRVTGYVWTTPKLKNSDCRVPDITSKLLHTIIIKTLRPKRKSNPKINVALNRKINFLSIDKLNFLSLDKLNFLLGRCVLTAAPSVASLQHTIPKIQKLISYLNFVLTFLPYCS